MRRAGFFTLMLIGVAGRLLADLPQTLEQADRLYEEGQHEESRRLLESALAEAGSPARQAEVHWRIARAWLNLGDQAEERKAPEAELLTFFEKGQAAARKAVAADPGNPRGYYWESGNIGRWGQIKGILNALSKAKPMRDLLIRAVQLDPQYEDAFYVLGQLYEQVPGPPISFGKKEWAVSLGRLAVDQRERQVAAGKEKDLDYDFYTELAKHLWERDWNSARRQKEQGRMKARYAAETDVLEKAFLFEGTLALPPLSDRQEALELLRGTVKRMEALPARTPKVEQDLKEARDVLKEWG